MLSPAARLHARARGKDEIAEPLGDVRRFWRDAFVTVRNETERRAAPLSPEDQVVQSMPDASPTKWHRAHVTWFFETFVLGALDPEYEPFHPSYAYLFNSYYEQIGTRHPRPDRGQVTRPGAAEVGAYRRAIDDRILTFLGRPSDVVARAAPIVELGTSRGA